MIGGTKGSHIVLEHPALVPSLKGQMIYFEADDCRICLVYDFLGLAMIGSTDIKASNPDDARCEPAEIDYFLEALRGLLPGLIFDRSQIIYAYAGIRPLPANDAANPGLISRDHSAQVIEPAGDRPYPVISLVGGKWTTYSGFAEEAADTVLTRLDRPRKISTRALPIRGGPADRSAWVAAQAKARGLPPVRVAHLLDRYGTTATKVMNHPGPPGDITDAPGYSLSELDWILRHEDVHDLSDLVMRRTTLAVTGSLTKANLGQIAALAAAALQWSEPRRAREIEKMAALVVKHLMQLPQADRASGTDAST